MTIKKMINKKLRFPDVDLVFPGKFPAGHRNNIKGWNFSREDVSRASRGGRMLTMDLDMGGRISCSLACRHCFNPKARLREKKGELLHDSSIREIIQQAHSVGLRSVKIIGPGEPSEQKILFDFLRFLRDLDIDPVIFTRATTLGSARHAKSIFSMEPEEVGKRLFDLGASLMITVNSFDDKTHIQTVQKAWYPDVMRRAIELASDIGFNDYIEGQPTRLGISINPITRSNIDEIFEGYRWARERNIYTIMSPLMVAGLFHECEVQSIIPDPDDLIEQYVKINLFAIDRGITTLEELEQKGIASYAGSCHCQQVGLGMFLRRDGMVFRCPGDDRSLQGSIRDSGIIDIWEQSENKTKYSGRMNVGCPPKESGGTFPEKFFETVLRKVRSILRSSGVSHS
jgi:MoaA/NifB/PqqE/SkfB family radical SAM enzyme